MSEEHDPNGYKASEPIKTQEEIRQAVATLIHAASPLAVFGEVTADENARANLHRALQILDGVNLYGSRFKVGDEVWVLHARKSGAWQVYPRPCRIVRTAFTTKGHITHQFFNDPDGIQGWRSDLDCFPTREEAEQEAARRNKETSDG